MLFLAIILCSLAAIGTAWNVPEIPGYRIMWSDNFEGVAGSLPDTSKWNIQHWYQDLNGDLQEYRASPENVHVMNRLLHIHPWRDPTATKGWTSGRIESTYTFTPAPGVKTIVQAKLELGFAPKGRKDGIWPAFWLLGDSHRTGGPIWPACGELDILEHVNTDHETHAAVHCDKSPGGICGEKKGISKSYYHPDSAKNMATYKVVIDRTPTVWQNESVNFYVNNELFHTVTAAQIGNLEVWKTIAWNKMFIIFNVAVGGHWPGPPHDFTFEGPEVGMRVAYVAHYEQQASAQDAVYAPSAYAPSSQDTAYTPPVQDAGYAPYNYPYAPQPAPPAAPSLPPPPPPPPPALPPALPPAPPPVACAPCNNYNYPNIPQVPPPQPRPLAPAPVPAPAPAPPPVAAPPPPPVLPVGAPPPPPVGPPVGAPPPPPVGPPVGRPPLPPGVLPHQYPHIPQVPPHPHQPPYNYPNLPPGRPHY
ncbi:endo-1 3-beta-glucanase [Fusarium mundagurra]|uniref:Endo-1 3-beta-glucanase n=1 Tax=Fusarium mundagurra TaxID=1567541 RepID=A0A8H6DAB9_9HYPO|nr:endo-1 3-beta-glucanase [Fusarium mundagurra]